jgi:hypothetical protein
MDQAALARTTKERPPAENGLSRFPSAGAPRPVAMHHLLSSFDRAARIHRSQMIYCHFIILPCWISAHLSRSSD